MQQTWCSVQAIQSVAVLSLFHRYVCSKLHCTKLTFLSELIQMLVSFWGAGRLFPIPWHQNYYFFPQLTISPKYPGDQWTNCLFGVVLYITSVFMPFLQQHRHEARRYLCILSDVTGCTFQSENVQHREGSLSSFNSACSLLFVTACIIEEQVAATTYYLKKEHSEVSLQKPWIFWESFLKCVGFFQQFL